MARKSSKRGGSAGKVFMGFLLGVVTVAGAGYAWMHYGGSVAKLRASLPSMPAGLTGADTAKPKPSIPDIPAVPVTRSRRTPPFGTSEDVFEGGAHVYRARCASCHGTPAHEASTGKRMAPPAPQLWKKGKRGAVGVSGDDPGDIYAQIAHGVHRSGMPAFASTLSDTQIWQVTLLMKNADKELPDPVMNILEGK